MTSLPLIFLSPSMLWFLIPVIIWGILARFEWKPLPSHRVKHSFVDVFLKKTTSPEPKFRRLLWRVTGVLLIIALAQPAWQRTDHSTNRVYHQANGMVILETSVNMLLQEGDGKSRLQQAQSMLSRLLTSRVDGRTGITVFADDVYPVMSLTQDTHALNSMISRLEPALAGREDSALLEAVQFAGWTLSQVTADNSAPAWLLLITDGAHSPSRGQLAPLMAWLKQHHIDLYVLMLGQEKPPERVDDHGLLYTPRNMALADQFASHGVSVTLSENTVGVQHLIDSLTQPTSVNAVVVHAQNDLLRLTNSILVLLLGIWLAHWWRVKRHS